MDTSNPVVDIASTGAFLLLPPKNQKALETSAELLRIADAFRGAPRALAASRAYRDAIEAVTKILPAPNVKIQDRLNDSKVLVTALENVMQDGWVESPSSLNGKKTKSPVWYQLVKLSEKKQQTPQSMIYLGAAILLALHHKQRIPDRISRHLDEMDGEEPLTVTQLNFLLDGHLSEETIGSTWIHTLQRDWRNLLRHYSDAPTPPPTKRGRIVGQILNTAIGGTTAHKAGASSHRQLSQRQMNRAIDFVRKEIERDTLLGALGLVVMATGFSVDLTAELDLLSALATSNWAAALCVQTGMLKIDYRIAVNEPARPLPGCEPSSFIRWIPLPENLHANLRNRLERYPSATTLRELFPEHEVPGHMDPLYPSHDDIQPTWARLRESMGVMLRQIGTNSLHVFLLTGDMGHIPRSKLHYATVGTAELWEQFSIVYEQCQWNAPVKVGSDLVGFGCQVVPTIETLKRHDQLLLDLVEKSRPGNHCNFELLYQFHNAFIRHAGWRLAMLLALRESAAIDLSAAISENDLWFPFHDKVTPHDRGAQPVPLAQFALETVAAIKSHCSSVWKRLSNTESSTTEFALWCKAVSKNNDVRLLCLVTDIGKTVPLSTHDFINSPHTDYILPPDAGRKALENLLRKEGLLSGHIDAVLRHVTSGQIRLSSVSSAEMRSWLTRSRASINKVAATLFGQVTHGISKD